MVLEQGPEGPMEKVMEEVQTQVMAKELLHMHSDEGRLVSHTMVESYPAKQEFRNHWARVKEWIC